MSDGGPGITHVVLIRWSESAPADLDASMRDAVEAARRDIPGIVDIVYGPSVSPEGLENGFGHGLVVRFTDAAARDGYLPHPTHRVLADLIGRHQDGIVVLDLEEPTP